MQLSLALEGVLSQILLPRAEGKGRVAAFEVMSATDAIRNLIREGRTEQIPSYIQTSSKYSMQSMDQHLEDLAKSGAVTYEEASIRMRKSYDRSGDSDERKALPGHPPVRYRGFK